MNQYSRQITRHACSQTKAVGYNTKTKNRGEAETASEGRVAESQSQSFLRTTLLSPSPPSPPSRKSSFSVPDMQVHPRCAGALLWLLKPLCVRTSSDHLRSSVSLAEI